MPLQQFDERYPLLVADHFLSTATPGDYVTLINSPGQDTRIDVWNLTNSDTIPHLVRIALTGGASNYDWGEVLVPAGAGYNGAVPVDVLAMLNPVGFHYVVIPNGQTVQHAIMESVNVGKAVVVNLFGGAF